MIRTRQTGKRGHPPFPRRLRRHGLDVLGVVFGILVPQAIQHFSAMRTIITPESLVLAFSISVCVGIVFGIYPARKAADMDPIEALRHE